jgi:hypothetical protein
MYKRRLDMPMNLRSDTDKSRDPVLMTSPEPPKAKAIASIGDNGWRERYGAHRFAGC